MSAIGRTTEWHETQKKYEVQKANKASELSIQNELKEANMELKILRKARLTELYQNEMERYEKELNDMGLAIVKDHL